MSRSILSVVAASLVFLLSAPALAKDEAHFYVAPFGGLAVPQKFSDVEGRGGLEGVTFSDLSLKNSGMVGLKVGFAPPAYQTPINWELEVFYSSPHVKQQMVTASSGGVSVPFDVTGSKVRHLVAAFNFVLRYPYGPVQPYAGFGPSVVWIRASGPDTGTGSDASFGLNLLAGTRLMASEHVGGFVEFKHNRSSADFPVLGGDANMSALVGGLVLSF